MTEHHWSAKPTLTLAITLSNDLVIAVAIVKSGYKAWSLKHPLYCLSNQYKRNTRRRGKEKERKTLFKSYISKPFFILVSHGHRGWFGLARDYPNCLWAKSGLYPGQVSSLSHLHSYSDLRPIQNSKFTSCASLWTLRGSWTTLEETHWTQEERVNSTHLFNFRLEK